VSAPFDVCLSFTRATAIRYEPGAGEHHTRRNQRSMNNRRTEKHRDRVTDETQATDDVPPLAACVRTLPEAVQVSLKDGVSEQCLFTFARALKAFEFTTRTKLLPADLGCAFASWWNAARPLLPGDPDFDEWRFDFENAYSHARSPLGANHLEEAIRRADSEPTPSRASRYTSSNIKRLVAACYHLQVLAGDGVFFLSVRDAARILGTKQLMKASAVLAGLVRDGVLTEISKGTPGGRKATRFQFNVNLLNQ